MKFLIEEDKRLIVLERMLFEAKFREESALTSHIPPSPVAAEMIKELVGVVDEITRKKSEYDYKIRKESRVFVRNNNPLLWEFCFGYAKKSLRENPDAWESRSPDDKLSYVRTLFCPNEISDSVGQEFLEELESSMN